MVETKVPKDIRKYKGKAIGPFSLRQILCGSITAIVDFGIYRLILKNMDISMDAKMFILCICAIPIMSFALEPYGMKMEVFLRDVVYKSFVFPRYRKNETDLKATPKFNTKEEQKQHEKEYRNKIKKNPEWRMFE